MKQILMNFHENYKFQISAHYLWPNIRVDRVSCSLNDDGEQQMIIVVRALPPFTKQKAQEISRTNHVVDEQKNQQVHVFDLTVHCKWFPGLDVLSYMYFRNWFKLRLVLIHELHGKHVFGMARTQMAHSPQKVLVRLFHCVNDSSLSVLSQNFQSF